MLLCAALVGFCGSDVSAEPLATSTARIQVKPHTAEVYVDGYLVGTVDSFDGFLQRLDCCLDAIIVLPRNQRLKLVHSPDPSGRAGSYFSSDDDRPSSRRATTSC